MTHQELIEQAIRGDEHAFVRLFDSVSGLAASIARLHAPPDEVEDCLQEIRLRFWLELHLSPSEHRFRAWTKRVFETAAIDYRYSVCAACAAPYAAACGLEDCRYGRQRLESA